MTDPHVDLVGSARLAENMEIFRRRIAEAQAQGVCIICEQPPTFYSEAGKREYRISGTCEPCFDRMFAEPPDEGEDYENRDPIEPHNDPNWMNP